MARWPPASYVWLGGNSNSTVKVSSDFLWYAWWLTEVSFHRSSGSSQNCIGNHFTKGCVDLTECRCPLGASRYLLNPDARNIRRGFGFVFLSGEYISITKQTDRTSEFTSANFSNKRSSHLSKSLNISDPPASPSPRGSSA